MRARYDAELPPFISIVRYPGRPVILVPDNLEYVKGVFQTGFLSLDLGGGWKGGLERGWGSSS